MIQWSRWTILNLKNYEEVVIFEIGKTYQIDQEKNPYEEYKLAGSLSNVSNDNLLELKQRLNDALNHSGFEISFIKKENPQEIFHPNGYFEIIFKNKTIGFLAQVHPRITDNLGSSKRLSVFEINIKNLI